MGKISLDIHQKFGEKNKIIDNDRHLIYLNRHGFAYLFHQSGSLITIEEEFELQEALFERFSDGPSPFLKPYGIADYVDDKGKFVKCIKMKNSLMKNIQI